jgi:hypothetical protein
MKRALPSKETITFIVASEGRNVVDPTLAKGKEALKSPRGFKIVI